MFGKKFHLIMFALSVVFLVPGLMFPMLGLQMKADIETQFFNKSFDLLNQEHSILTTMKELWNHGAETAAVMIFFFSIVNPIGKSLLYLFCLTKKNAEGSRKKGADLLSFVSKWSFADVFIVAILVAFLTSARNPDKIREIAKVMGMSFPIEISTPLLAWFGSGFYFFTLFCFFSNVGISVFVFQNSRRGLSESPK